jgi:hypothetical protein
MFSLQEVTKQQGAITQLNTAALLFFEVDVFYVRRGGTLTGRGTDMSYLYNRVIKGTNGKSMKRMYVLGEQTRHATDTVNNSISLFYPASPITNDGYQSTEHPTVIR